MDASRPCVLEKSQMKQKDHHLITNMNAVAHENLSQFLSKPYQINKDGEDFVIEANRKLPDSYFTTFYSQSLTFGHRTF